MWVIGNWKMHKTSKEAEHFINEFLSNVSSKETKVGVAAPFTALSSLKKFHEQLYLGAQNMHDHVKGAYTGEISAPMLKEENVHFVLLGHSERRIHFQESNAFINSKVKRAVEEDLIAVLCIGETKEERETGFHSVLKKQIDEGLKNISSESLDQIILAYEPVWAIGTGKTALPEDAEEVHIYCRNCLRELYPENDVSKVPILYGGSVKPENCKELFQQKNIDGALVGGACLSAKSFAQIVQGGI